MSYTPEYVRVNWQNEPNLSTPLNALNLNKMDYTVKKHDDTFANWDTTKANQSDLLLSVKEITYNSQTGVFVFTWQNGTTMQVDLNTEKIPVSFSMDANGIITMTTDDGTQYTADVGSLIKTYTFTDSGVIDFTVTTDASGNKTVTADIVNGSITGEKLQPNYLADCQAAQTGAEQAESDSEAWAKGTRNGTPVESTDPTYHNNSKYYSEQSVHTTFASLTDVNINNLQNGQVPVYNSTTHKWENKNGGGGGASSMDQLTDVDLTGLEDNDALIYNLSSGMWKVESGHVVTVSLTQAQYDALTPSLQIDPHYFYVITDATDVDVEINDNSVASDTVWSSQKVNNLVKVNTFEVSATGWVEDVISQSGTTLYKKQVSLNHIYLESPSIDIGSASGSVLPTTAQQEAYDLIQYVTVDTTIPCLYLYASDAPTDGFYINVEGVD